MLAILGVAVLDVSNREEVVLILIVKKHDA